MERALPIIQAPQSKSAFKFQFAAPLNPGNINTSTGNRDGRNAAANTNTFRQRKIIATSQIRQEQPVTAVKQKGKRPAIDRLLSESTSAAGSQANPAAASKKSDGESQVGTVEQEHRRKRSREMAAKMC